MRHPKQTITEREQMLQAMRAALADKPEVDLGDERAVSDIIYASGAVDDYAPCHVDAAIPQALDMVREHQQREAFICLACLVFVALGILPAILSGGINP